MIQPQSTPTPTPTPSGAFYNAYEMELNAKRIGQAMLSFQEIGLRAFPTGSGIQVNVPLGSEVFVKEVKPTGWTVYEIQINGRGTKTFEVPAPITLEFLEDPVAR